MPARHAKPAARHAAGKGRHRKAGLPSILGRSKGKHVAGKGRRRAK